MSQKPGSVGLAPLIFAISLYGSGYAYLALTGQPVFIFKSALIPAFALYGLFSKDVQGFIVDWLPFLGLAVLFDAGRGAAFALVQSGHLPIHYSYPIAFDEMIAGTKAVPAVLQTAMRTPALDRLALFLHGAHFIFFLFLGLVIWHVRRQSFTEYTTVVVALLYLGLAFYFAVPTAPPWLAARNGLLPAIAHITAESYTRSLPVLYRAFDTNPVAAMPSLHVALPIACALSGSRAFGRRVGICLGAYAAMVALAMIYLGEHYLVDVLAGAIAAIVVFAVVTSTRLSRPHFSVTNAVLFSVAVTVVALVLVQVSHPFVTQPFQP